MRSPGGRLLWVHPKSNPPFQSTPKSFACEKGLYDTSDHAEFDIDIESWLSGVEGLYAKRWPEVFNEIRDSRTKMNLARFIALQHLRNPEQKKSTESINEAFRKIAATAEPGQKEITIIGFDNEEIKISVDEILKHSQDTPQNTAGGFLRSLQSNIDDLAGVLAARKWGVVIANTPAFITSDNPVILLRRESTRRTFGFRTPGTEVIFPITPTMILSIRDEWNRDGLHYPLVHIGSINNDILGNARRFAFSASPLRNRNGNVIASPEKQK